MHVNFGEIGHPRPAKHGYQWNTFERRYTDVNCLLEIAENKNFLSHCPTITVTFNPR